MLVCASCTDGLSRYAIYDDAFVAILSGGLAPSDQKDFLFGQPVILEAMGLQLENDFFKSTHLQLIAHDMDDVSAGHNTQFGVKGLYHLHVHVVHSV